MYRSRSEKSSLFQSTLPLQGATANAETPRFFCCYFNPRSPYGERPKTSFLLFWVKPDFNPRSPYGERLSLLVYTQHRIVISIHAPLTGSDYLEHRSLSAVAISIHAPLTGSDLRDLTDDMYLCISIHAPLTGSDCRYAAKIVALQQISIHAPLTGSDGPATGPCT